MKTGTEEHLKFKQLKKLLGKPQYIAIGVLESLWHMACRNADEGDIGKYDNVQIADGMEWDGDPDELITALVESGFIDEVDDARRLVIHDWEDHCPDFIKKRIRRKAASRKRQETVESGSQCPTVADNGGHRQTTADNGDQREEVGANGAITQPNPTKPNPTKPDSAQSGDCSPSIKIPKPEQLDELITAFEALPLGIGHKIRNRRSKEICKGWCRVQKDPEWREAFEDIPTLMTGIRDGTVMHGTNWWKFIWLFKTGELGEKNVQKILDGNYDDGKNRNQKRDPARIESSSDSHKLFK